MQSGRTVDLAVSTFLTHSGHRIDGIAERKIMDLRAGPTGHSGLMLAARITLPHFSVSSAINLPKSAGESASAALPNSASRAFSLGSASAALISLLSLSVGVFLGAPMPYQLLAS